MFSNIYVLYATAAFLHFSFLMLLEWETGKMMIFMAGAAFALFKTCAHNFTFAARLRNTVVCLAFVRFAEL